MVIVWCDHGGLWWSRSMWTCWDILISIGWYRDNELSVSKNWNINVNAIINAIINNHIINILHQNNKRKDERNCRNKKYFLLGEKCLSPNAVYQGKITSIQPNYKDKVYFGVAEKSFKDRFYNHTKSFTHTGELKGTTLLQK